MAATAERASPALSALLERLASVYGPQRWWPAESAFEMAVGAVLVQHTTWANAASAIRRLSAAGALAPRPMRALESARLQSLIRPSGTFRVKATRLLQLTRWWLDDMPHVRACDTATLRRSLLGVHGIGPETADCILVYAFDRPVFVADGFARRILTRLGHGIRGADDYEAVRRRVESQLPVDATLLGEAHALMVAHARRHCRARAVCQGCPLAAECRTALDSVSDDSR